jgi:hypothetical protein
MKKSLLLCLSISLFLLAFSWQYGNGQTYHDLSSVSFSQDWTNTGLITTNDLWTSVPSIQGFFGADASTTATGTDPQTILVDFSELDVIANQSATTISNGGVAEFEITDPVIAFQGSGSADYPNIVIYLNGTSRSNIRVQYDLRDVDGGNTDNTNQQVALQYRIGTSGNFTNISSGYVADASTGPNLATLVTHIDVILPAECNGQSQIQVRIITSNAPSSDEWIGVDNIAISSSADETAPIPTFNPTNVATDVLITVIPTITFNEPVRKTDGSALESSDLSGLIVFKKTSSGGVDVAYTAAIDASKKVITVTPTAALDNAQVYYLEMKAVEDLSGNDFTGANITFTTIAAATPTVTITYPVGGETFYAGDPTTITWTSANITNVKIEAWVVGDTRTWKYETMVASTPASAGSFAFSVPSDALYGTQYKIKLSDVDNPAVYSESGSFTCIAVATSLANLRTRCILDDIVKLSSEVTMTFKRATGNQKYVQDATAGLLIYDNSAVLTTVLAIGDNFKNLEGKVAFYGGVYEIIPTKTTVTVTSSGNSVTIPEMSLTDYNTNYLNYESELIKLSDVTFPGADGSAVFTTASNNFLTDGTTTITFRTFATGESDIVGAVIPTGHIKMTCIAGFYTTTTTTVQVYSRTLSDFEIIPTAVEKTLSNDEFKMYPVPASSVLNISNVPNLKSIEILDVTGRVVRTINSGTDELLQIPVTGLRRGIYMIRFNTANGKVVKRFVKS